MSVSSSSRSTLKDLSKVFRSTIFLKSKNKECLKWSTVEGEVLAEAIEGGRFHITYRNLKTSQVRRNVVNLNGLLELLKESVNV